jgi:hypothetical protein
MAKIAGRASALLFAVLVALAAFALSAGTGFAQQGTLPPPANAPNAEFLETADNVLADMSKLLSLPVLTPLKKSVRSREEIRAYLVRSMNDDKDDAKRHADQKALEAMGLIPKDYPLDQTMLSLLTEQIAGLYDPKGREFFIADWTDPVDQQMIMAHELTHALQDQHFQIEKWQDAAKPNDDAGLAREAVLEGTATVAMVDYLLRDTGKSARDLPGLDASLLLGDVNDSPELAKAPLVIRDELLFPYVAGAAFSQRMLKEWNGWPDVHKLFDNPPGSTQQIMHPDLYLQGVTRQPVTLPNIEKMVPAGWKKLDENLLGEFGVSEILKQFVGQQRADDLGPMWAGDRYAIFERQPGGQTLLVIRLRLQSEEAAARFFGGYSEVLEDKHAEREQLFRRPNFFSFETPEGGVFWRCYRDECVSVEGATRPTFDAITGSLGWPPGPVDPREPEKKQEIAARPVPQAMPVSGRGAVALAAR